MVGTVDDDALAPDPQIRRIQVRMKDSSIVHPVNESRQSMKVGPARGRTQGTVNRASNHEIAVPMRPSG